jgi:uncharacterized repeat protein (TIGR03803 family)
LFKLNKNGTSYSVFYSFTGLTNGIHPFGTLAQGTDGVLYGTTQNGGVFDFGAVFRINTNGSNQVVRHHFDEAGGDGTQPAATLLLGSDGALYGSTYSGGDADSGTLFRLFSFAPRIAFTGIQRNGNGALLSLSGGAAGLTYNIQATTNLLVTNAWQVIGSSEAGIDGRFQFLDAGATNRPVRFYRSTVP